LRESQHKRYLAAITGSVPTKINVDHLCWPGC
jgi:hypothetical protein